MQQCPNAWADVAFTPVENVKELLRNDFSDRVLWGTDYPIQRAYYKDSDQEQLYLKRLDEVRSVMFDMAFDKLTYINFNQLF